MTVYNVSILNPTQQYIQFSVEINADSDTTVICLSKWRPGRYELGNFAKNVKRFKVFGTNGKQLSFEKRDSSSWIIQNGDINSFKVEYSYFAAELNAGSSFLNKDQLYVNPVNCCIYVEGKEDTPCKMNLAIPENWEVATSMEKEGSAAFIAASFHELADSPFICSANLLHNSYEVGGTTFHIWFNGLASVPWEKVIDDFKKFTETQISAFIEFPVKEYHFLNQIVPYKAYHGVEHQKSTVILLGPSYSVFTEGYDDLLGVSSHELYHTWNVKAIRPIEMFPYNYQKENYSKLGYLCEGITTYMGDLHLLKSGVFSWKDYVRELSAQLQKHFDNFGRFNYSVADSSFDTWLDGYTPGAPGRKVSIYVEGCLLAFVMDVKLLSFSNGKYGLDEFMKRLYFNFALQRKGVSEEDFRSVLTELGGDEMNTLLDNYVYGTNPFESILTEAFDTIGLELKHEASKKYAQGRLGLKALPNGHSFIVKAIYPGSPAEIGGLMLEDEIIAVNNHVVNGELDAWLNHFDDEQKVLMVQRAGMLKELHLPEVQRPFYVDYSFDKLETLTHLQTKLFGEWSRK
jgi:predicted metalloprotease with PDZ domain